MPEIEIPEGRNRHELRLGGRTIALTNLKKIFWPAGSITKRELLTYYGSVSAVLLPHLRDRAMVMKRYPNGIEGEFFFMKRAPAGRPEWIETCSITHRSASVIDFPMVQDLASLLWVVNLGCIDLNPWYATCADVNRPDYLHFDLDPVPPAAFPNVLEAALLLRDYLLERKIRSYPKTTGSRGLHVYVQIQRGPLQKEVWTVAKRIAQELASRRPAIITAEYRIAKRPAGRVLVDYNQNAWGRTLASVYSVRPVPAATVSTPVAWAEIEKGIRMEDFRMGNIPARVKELGDLFKAGDRAARAGASGVACVKLPLALDYPPMEARVAARIPEGPEWRYEPKWDGFRCLAFRAGDEVEMISKSQRPLTRYFPEVAAALKAIRADRFVLDGELIIPCDGKLDFDALLQRIHPAETRIRKLSKETPATFVVFDLLVDEKGVNLTGETFSMRREALARFAREFLRNNRRFRLSPSSGDLPETAQWRDELAGSIDGIIAKRADLPYESGERTGMLKIKNRRTADCVVGGFRYAAKKPVVGSLLLGLYDDAHLLHHVGFTSSMASDEKPALTKTLEKLVAPPGFTGAAPGGPSRWSTERSGQWQPLRPKLVAEVQYDHISGRRFRHGTKFVRWRADKRPDQCTFEQIGL